MVCVVSQHTAKSTYSILFSLSLFGFKMALKCTYDSVAKNACPWTTLEKVLNIENGPETRLKWMSHVYSILVYINCICLHNIYIHVLHKYLKSTMKIISFRSVDRRVNMWYWFILFVQLTYLDFGTCLSLLGAPCSNLYPLCPIYKHIIFILIWIPKYFNYYL